MEHNILAGLEKRRYSDRRHDQYSVAFGRGATITLRRKNLDSGSAAVRPRILIVSPWPALWSMAPGAGVSDESHMFAGLVRAGYDLDLLVPRPAEIAGDIPGVTVHTMPNVLAIPRRIPAPLARLWLLPAFWTVASRAAVRLARARRPVLVFGFSHYGAWPAWRAGRAAKAPSVLKLFGVMHAMRLEWPLARYLYHSLEGVLAFKVPVDHFLILNDGTRGDVVARRWGVPAARITYLPNGIDTQWADRPDDRDATRRAFATTPETVVFLSLSRLVLSKRVDRIVDAMARARQHAPQDIVLWVAGDGPLRGELERRCRAAGLDARFLGTVAHADVASVLAAADVFVSASTLTNMSIPTCEAMVMGVPVVALDVGGTAEVVRHGETGLLVPEGDPAALAAALARMAGDAALRKQLGAGAKAFAKREFMSWEARVDAEVTLVNRLVRSPGTAPTAGASTA